jgi:hypothetical protein
MPSLSNLPHSISHCRALLHCSISRCYLLSTCQTQQFALHLVFWLSRTASCPDTELRLPCPNHHLLHTTDEPQSNACHPRKWKPPSLFFALICFTHGSRHESWPYQRWFSCSVCVQIYGPGRPISGPPRDGGTATGTPAIEWRARAAGGRRPPPHWPCGPSVVPSPINTSHLRCTAPCSRLIGGIGRLQYSRAFISDDYFVACPVVLPRSHGPCPLPLACLRPCVLPSPS